MSTELIATTREERDAARKARIAARANRPAVQVCHELVERMAAATGQDLTFGYLGNCDAYGDDRSWFVFFPHPGRVGTSDDRMGGFRTKDLDKMVHFLQGALVMNSRTAR